MAALAGAAYAQPATSTAPSPASESLAAFVPRDTPVFAEIAELRQLEEQLSQSDWGSVLLSILVGRPDDPNSGTAALSPLASLLGINDPVAARRTLLGHRVAIAMPGWTDVAGGVLLAIPEQSAHIEGALQQGGRQPTAIGRARQYILDDQGHCISTDGKVVLFGQSTVPPSLYDRSLQILAGQDPDSLASDANYQRELATLGPQQQRAVLYFSFPPPASQPAVTQPATAPAPATSSAPTSRPTPPVATAAAVVAIPSTRPSTQPAAPEEIWLPPGWPRMAQGVIGLGVEGPIIRLGIRGQLDRPLPETPAEANVKTLNSLPATTLAAWAQAIDYEAEYRALSEGAPSLLRLYLIYLNTRLKAAGSSMMEGLLGRFGHDTVFLLGVVPAAEQPTSTGFDLPAAGAIIPVRQPPEVGAALDVIGTAIVGMLDAAPIREKMARPLELRKVAFAGTTIAEVNLGDFFQAQTKYPFAQAIGLSWAVTDRDLILSTSTEHVKQILRARRGQAPTLATKIAGMGDLNHFAAGTHAVLLAQPVAIAAMFDNWLSYLGQHNPELLSPDWWRAQQRERAARVNLGFRISGTRPGAVVVAEALEGWPAFGRLQTGDVIVAADGHALAQEDPKASLRAMIAERKQIDRLTLTVERNGQRTDVVIPLPDLPGGIDPVAAIRQFSRLLAPFAGASYNVWFSRPDRFNARVVLLCAPATASRPATQPAPTSTAPATTAPAAVPTTAPIPAVAPAPPPPPPPATQAASMPPPPTTSPATAPATQPS